MTDTPAHFERAHDLPERVTNLTARTPNAAMGFDRPPWRVVRAAVYLRHRAEDTDRVTRDPVALPVGWDGVSVGPPPIRRVR